MTSNRLFLMFFLLLLLQHSFTSGEAAEGTSSSEKGAALCQSLHLCIFGSSLWPFNVFVLIIIMMIWIRKKCSIFPKLPAVRSVDDNYKILTCIRCTLNFLGSIHSGYYYQRSHLVGWSLKRISGSWLLNHIVVRLRKRRLCVTRHRTFVSYGLSVSQRIGSRLLSCIVSWHELTRIQALYQKRFQHYWSE